MPHRIQKSKRERRNCESRTSFASGCEKCCTRDRRELDYTHTYVELEQTADEWLMGLCKGYNDDYPASLEDVMA